MMNSLVLADSATFAAAECEAVASLRNVSSTRAAKPKQAFADTPPMAKVREASRSDKSDAPKGDIDYEQAFACQEGPAEQAVDSRPANGEPTELQSDPVMEEAATPSGESPAEQGAASTADSSPQVSANVENAADQLGVGQLKAIGGSAPTSPSAANSYTAANAETANAELALPGADLPSNQAESQAVASGASVLAQADGAGAVTVSEMSAETGQAASDAEAAGSRDAAGAEQALGPGSSNADVVAQDKTEEATGSVASVAGEAALTQSGQETSGANANSGNLHKGQAAPAALETAERDTVASSPEDTTTLAPRTDSVQLEGQINSAVGQTKDAFSIEVEEGAKAQAEPLIETPADAPAASESTLTQADAVAGLEGSGEKSPVQSVGEQILDSVQAALVRADKQVTVRLNPPELGSVTVRFQEDEGQITGVLEVSKDQTRQEVEQALPQVVRGLQEAGVPVWRLEVVVGDQPEGDQDREPLPKEAWGQQEGSEQHNSQAGDSPAGRRSTWAAAQQSPLEVDEIRQGHIDTAQGRIDMLV
ncbi:MAG: flagellar hook-length control protein FliK [Phycisphaerales bacterium]|nr:MAG: flagellar hook-length control protein FliK [Phycisphaerales bacterium]